LLFLIYPFLFLPLSHYFWVLFFLLLLLFFFFSLF
jgi:hypothetical protein